MQLPSTRIYNSLWQAIEKVLKFELLEKIEQEEIREQLNKIPIDDDAESMKRFINMKYDKTQIKRILTTATNIINKKEQKDKKEQEEEVKKFGNNIDEAAKSFQADYVDFAEAFWKTQPFYYDPAKIWWLWNFKEFYWERIDETDLLNRIYVSTKAQGIRVTSSSIKSEITTSLKMVGRKHKPIDAPIRWIQFRDVAFSLRSKKIHKITPDYFFTNPIPWELGESNNTPIMDKLFMSWVGEKNLDDLYEFISYCCYRNYPIQLLFCLYGHGRNGKSTFINIVDKFLGSNNTCTTELDMIAGKNKSRFETIRLFKKLACFMGETNFSILENSSILKKLVGGDKIGFEVKGAGLFDDFNYAKIIIASNSLPSSEDTSEGFYRRWHIINFENEFPEGKDISLIIPDKEFSNLAKRITELLPTLLEKGKFTNQGTIEERKQRYIMASNPLPYFIDTYCYLKPDGYIRYSKFYQFYTKFLKLQKKRIINKKEFTKVLISEGLENRKTSKEGNIDYYVEGIEFIDDFPDFPDFNKRYTSSPCKEMSSDLMEIEEIKEKTTGNDIIPEEEVIDFIEDIRKNDTK